jgi:osmotically-inducible protein OsmY
MGNIDLPGTSVAQTSSSKSSTMGQTPETHRTDADIFTAARNALDQRPTIPATVRVYVDRGIATLTGSVRLPSERADAEEAIRHVDGIQRVVNSITVAQPVSAEGFEPPW